MALKLGAAVAGVMGGYAFARDQAGKAEDREYQAKVRQYGIRKMAAEDQLLDTDTENKKARQTIEAADLEHKRLTQPREQALQTADLASRETLQPVQQATAAAQAQTGLTTAQGAQAAAPDVVAAQQAELQKKLGELKVGQTVGIWTLLRNGDKDGALKALSKSNLLYPGQEFSDIQRGTWPVTGDDGKPMLGPDGKEVREKVVALVPKDGNKAPVIIPEKALESLYERANTKVEKVGKGDSLVRVGPGGQVKPVYQDDEFAVNTETGGLFNKRTGAAPAAAGVGAPAGGAAGRKQESHADDRVKMAIDKVILPKYGGRFEGGMFFPDEKNKDVALRATALAGQYVRGGMAPEAAGAKAVADAERESAVKAVSGGSNNTGAGGYAGPAPWK